ncbi:MAG TPA: transglutaminaseTgpA domain-containing protein [Gaiellaceae bacterium]
MALLPAAVIAATWLRLEGPRDDPTRVVAVILLALAPALVRPRAARVAVLVVIVGIGARVAFGLSVLHSRHALGHIGTAFANGFLDFYDVRVPFDPRVHAEMRSVILVAVFGFVLALGLSTAARSPLAATLVVLLGAGWPATLAGPTGGLGAGVAILLAVLVVLAGLTARRVPRAAVPAAVGLALAAFVVSSSSAVAKGELVPWQSWDFYNAPTPPVSVSYVWNAQYGGLHFPRKRTTVLEIKAPPAALYWRAALLDRFAGDRWTEVPPTIVDFLEPAASRDRTTWVRQVVTVKALSDTHLIGAATQVAFDAGDAPVARASTGGTFLPGGLTRGFQYTVWSYAPQPRPAELNRSRPLYPAALTRPQTLLDVWPGVTVPPFGVAQRTRRLTALLDAHPALARYVPLEKAALAVAKGARSPYAAAIALESWFRGRGGFTYTNHPPVFSEAPLVGFVVQTREGYCQYFAGAMALMLRYLGVPARVAVGFSSGTYDAHRGVWTVTDHDAHAWVEAWFHGYGWLPFDPTPGAGRPERGQLGAPYSAGSPRFSLRATGITVAGGPSAPAQAAHRHGEADASQGGGGGDARGSSAAGRHDSLLVLLALLLGAALAGLVLTKLAVRRARYVSRDPRRIAAACRQELADFLLDQRIDAARSATLHELGELVREELAVDPDRFVAAATAARFGRPTGARPAAYDARRELRALMRVVRARLTFRERLRGLLSLRSLGFAP